MDVLAQEAHCITHHPYLFLDFCATTLSSDFLIKKFDNFEQGSSH